MENLNGFLLDEGSESNFKVARTKKKIIKPLFINSSVLYVHGWLAQFEIII